MRIKDQRGFTIIELLVASAIVITSATVVMEVMIATFRGSTRVNNQEELRQAGETALTRVVTVLDNADNFVRVGNADDFSGGVGNCINDNASNYNWITLMSEGITRTIACTTNGDTKDLQLDGGSLFPQANINVASCTITCSQVTLADPPVITVSVNLANSLIDNTLPEQNASLSTFSKTIKMRNP